MIEVKIPKLGLTMENATVARWTVRSGDEVRKEEVILVIETDKVTYEVVAPADGIVHPAAAEGAVCGVEEVVGYIARDRTEYEKIVKQYPIKKAGEETPEKMSREAPVTAPVAAEGARIKSSPLARAMARAHNLDLAGIRGTGPGGRIVRADILSALEGAPGAGIVAAGREESPFPAVVSKGKSAAERIAIKGARKVISENMFMSISSTAQLTLHTEAGAEAILRLRERLSRGEEKVSFNAILVKMAATVLRRHPRLNATVEGSEIVVWREIHIGLAMESGDFLVVPVVRNPELKSIREIDAEIKELAQKARQGGLSPDDMANGTFTITNLGFGDIDLFTPIIRPPECAILGLGRIVRKPWVREDRVVPESRMGLSLTFDHRILDGAPAARFLKELKDTVEDPLLLLG
jgi:pyruvate/2-oxoglutarate dehydrogenase complex dihydrolipoamide acyltransferase (E2) component